MGARPQHRFAYRQFCALLRGWRVEAGLTQRAMARLLAKPASYVHKSEVGDRRIDALEFISWCVACRRDPSRSLHEVRRRVL
jgi:predicted transcriptional regulator